MVMVSQKVVEDVLVKWRKKAQKGSKDSPLLLWFFEVDRVFRRR